MEMSPQRVRSAEFKTVRKGADPDEVKVFLNEVADELERAQNQSTAMEARARAAVARLQEVSGTTPAPAPAAVDASTDEAETISRTLLLAQRTADTTVAEARGEAARIVSAANNESATTLDSTREMAAQLLAEARVEARRLGEAERGAIAGEVEALKARRTSSRPTSNSSSCSSPSSEVASGKQRRRSSTSPNGSRAASVRFDRRCCLRPTTNPTTPVRLTWPTMSSSTSRLMPMWSSWPTSPRARRPRTTRQSSKARGATLGTSRHRRCRWSRPSAQIATRTTSGSRSTTTAPDLQRRHNLWSGVRASSVASWRGLPRRRPPAELSPTRRRHPRSVGEGRHLPGLDRPARRRRARLERVRVLRRAAVCERSASLRPPPDGLRQRRDSEVPDDARPPCRATVRLGLPRASGRGQSRAGARHLGPPRHHGVRHRQVQRRLSYQCSAVHGRLA